MTFSLAWHIFFHSLWKDFHGRFDNIIQNLERHRDLVDREALSIDIVEAREWRQKTEAEVQERERRERIVQLQGAIAWLAVEGLQEDDLDRLLRASVRNTADWILAHPKIKSWIEDNEGEPVTWLKGIPGAGMAFYATITSRRLMAVVGKSILCARLTQFLQDETDIPTLYFFCNRYITSKKLCSEIFRTLVSQLLHLNSDLSLHIYDQFIQKGRAPSMVQLRILLEQLLTSIPSSRIVIDGLDECQEADRKEVMLELFKMTKLAETSCKLFLSCRDYTSVPRPLKRMPVVCLTTEKSSVDFQIRIYVKERLAEIQEEEIFQGHNLDDIEESIMDKTQGMSTCKPFSLCF